MSRFSRNNGVFGTKVSISSGIKRLSKISGSRQNGGILGKEKILYDLTESVNAWDDSVRLSGIFDLAGLRPTPQNISTPYQEAYQEAYQETYWVYPASYNTTINYGNSIYGTWNPSPEECNYRDGVMWTSMGISGLDLRGTANNFQWANVGACPWTWTGTHGGSPYTYTVYPSPYTQNRTVYRTAYRTAYSISTHNVWSYF
jgi:hypothetical protein